MVKLTYKYVMNYFRTKSGVHSGSALFGEHYAWFIIQDCLSLNWEPDQW